MKCSRSAIYCVLLFVVFSAFFIFNGVRSTQVAREVESYEKAIISVETEESFTELTTIEVVSDVIESTTKEYTTQEQTLKKSTTAPVKQDELYLLSHIIYAEAGADTCSDKMQLYVGSVVLNRIKHHLFPNTMSGVVYQKGQYSCVKDGNFSKKPNQRAIDNAKFLLENGSQLPDNVVFQAGFKQGHGVHEKVGNIYFCYTNY